MQWSLVRTSSGAQPQQFAIIIRSRGGIPVICYSSKFLSSSDNVSFHCLSNRSSLTRFMMNLASVREAKWGQEWRSSSWFIVTAMAMALFTVVHIFIGRFIQAIASSFMWVVGYATIADSVDSTRLGVIYGIISVAAAVGLSAGPMVSGVLFKIGGYWTAWTSAFAILLVDIVLRFLMLENPRRKREKQSDPSPADDGPHEEENSPLLRPDNDTSTASRPVAAPETVEEKTGLEYYVYMFRHRRFVTGVLGYFVFAILISSFDTTLPLHVRDAFDWDSMPAGLMFLALQGPGIALSPLVGWLKDRVGTQIPTTIGFLGLAPLMWLLGVPGDERFPWANQGQRGPIIYAMDVTAVGIVSVLLNGVGVLEATATIDEIEHRHPGIFGPHGGYSRAMSICSQSWTIGAFFGPILSGYMAEHIGITR
ncbi:MFS multidrug transporter, putative [Aspergillus fumigatus Af293]|uniref:MFS multidrug transporter, putative n=1 Tax=Aspergillus fumigatus (strain ATCC MYA-4609 / CBS 101355 / FGSC A1100 / Af293) TaxID=330879 RepID=Q4WIS8_ASPFU|nr:MFS multidrug transporter, putative [Aspergillus fumigatus Af293]EAL87177.1 MFS multidrug transporter, putative [Aspergillus fumigatus Af293]